MLDNAGTIASVNPSAIKFAQLGLLKIAESACRQHGDKVWIGEGQEALLVLAGARHLRFFLENESSFHKELDNEHTSRRLLLGQSLITAREGEEWHLARKLTAPLVNPKSAVLKQGTRDAAHWLVNRLQNVGNDSMQEICLQWALRCVAEGFVGPTLSPAQLDGLVNHFRRIYLQLIVLAPAEDYGTLSRHPALIAFRQELESLLGPLINGGASSNASMLQRFCQALEVDAHPQERERAISMLLGNLVASVDNTGVALLWCLTHLSQHGHYQQQVREECRQGTRDMAGAIVKESLRITPVTAFFERFTLGPLDIDGVTIPSATKVLFSPWLVQRNAAYWPEPLSFRPERFLEGKKIAREHFVPFSIGKRNCVGMALAMDQLTTAIETVCSHCAFALAPSTALAALTALYGLNVLPRGPIYFTIESADEVTAHECIA
ncbi:cytochrome P450 [Pseudomonas orientalis]|uniref:cytochrome P450 n=1 Tax=Pseudomonas orientalis TaxID=76758 RepID=UPI0034D4EB06